MTTRAATPSPLRLLQSARKAGWPNARLEVAPDGKTVLHVSDEAEPAPAKDAWATFKVSNDAAETVAPLKRLHRPAR